MSKRFLLDLCSTVHKPKIAELCKLAQLCDYEKEILLDYYCEPRKKILALEMTTRDNFTKRNKCLIAKVKSFLADNKNFLAIHNTIFLTTFDNPLNVKSSEGFLLLCSFLFFL